MEPIRFRVRKHLALLVYLAVEPGAHRRDHLAELLWPGSSGSQSRQSLATALSFLRAKLPGAIEGSRDRVWLNPEAIDLDLHRLRERRLVPELGVPALQLAGFLAEFDIPDAPGFMHWRDGQRAHWLPHIRSGLLTLIDHCRRTGDSVGMESHAERLLAVDDLAEEGILACMEARALAGDRLTALRIYETWTERAKRELDLAPSAALEGMALRLRRRGWERTTRADIPPVQTDQWRGRVFVGRATEYRLLYETWERVQGGTPSHVLVEGDSGVGKSTLVARLATAAGLAGASLARVQSFELEQGIPYATITGLLRVLLDRPGVRATAPEALAELGRTMPEIRRRYSDLPTPSDATGEAARIHFAEAAQEMIRAVMDEHPLILVVDDVHLADEASLTVLHLLMRWIDTGPWAVLLTSRAGAGESPNAARLRQQAEPLRVRLLALEPMGAADAGELLDILLSPDSPRPSSTQRRTLLKASAGYPMVLELLVQDWQARGPDSVALAVDAMTEDMAAGPSDAAHRRLFDRVMADLDPTGLSVLKLASILDRRLSELDFYSLVDLTPSQALVGLAEVTQSRALRDGNGGGLEFVNQAIRAQAYLSVPSPLRRTLHSQIADRLLAMHGDDREAVGLEIAWHCIRGGRVGEATPYLLTGAREAVRRGAPHEAEMALRSGKDHLFEGESIEATILLAEVLHEQSRWQESLDVLYSIPATASAEQKERCNLLEIAALAELRSRTLVTGTIPATLWDSIDSGSSTSIRLLAALLASKLADRVTAPALLKRLNAASHSLPTEAFSPEQRAFHMFITARLAYFNGDQSGSYQTVLAALDVLEHAGINHSLVPTLHLGLSAIACATGQYPDALIHSRRAYAISLTLGNDRLAGAAASNAAICDKRIGNFSGQIDWGEKALALLAPSRTAEVMSASASIATGSAALGEGDRAVEVLRNRLEPEYLNESDFISQRAALFCADTYRLLGDRRATREWATAGTTGKHTTLHSLASAGPFSRWVASISSEVGEHRIATEKLLELKPRMYLMDAIDRAEFLASLIEVQGNGALTEGPLRADLDAAVAALPTAVAREFQRLARVL